MVTALGETDNPTSSGQDPNVLCGTFAQFVKDNNLDGLDLDYEDN